MAPLGIGFIWYVVGGVSSIPLEWFCPMRGGLEFGPTSWLDWALGLSLLRDSIWVLWVGYLRYPWNGFAHCVVVWSLSLLRDSIDAGVESTS